MTASEDEVPPFIDVLKRLKELEEQYDSLQKLMCFVVNKVGNPVIITTRDIEVLPTVGNLMVQTDPVTQSIMITFAEETTIDTETSP